MKIILFLLLSCATAQAGCTKQDIARFEMIYGRRGTYHSDPRFQVTFQYLGTSIKNGICYVALRPVR